MKKITGLVLILLMIGSLTGIEWSWADSFGSSAMDWAWSITADDNNNAIITGSFEEAVQFGDYELISCCTPDVFICKVSSDGTVLWAVQGISPDEAIGLEVETDSDNNVYATGYFSDSIVFDETALYSYGSWDVFIVKYSPTGELLWAKSAGGTGQNIGYGLAVDTDHNVYVTGWFVDTINFDGLQTTSSGGSDIYLVKYDPNGDALWLKSFGGYGQAYGYKVKTDNQDRVFVTGVTSYTAYFDDIILEQEQGMFVAAINPEGDVLWVQNGVFAGVNTLDIDSTGNVGVIGRITGQAFFDGVLYQTACESDDIYVGKISPEGDWLWIKQFGNNLSNRGRSLAFAPDGDIFAAASYVGDVEFDDYQVIGNDTENLVLLRLDDNGEVVSLLTGNSEQPLIATGVTLSSDYYGYLTGYYYGNATFGAHDVNSSHDYDMNIFYTRFTEVLSVDDKLLKPLQENLLAYPNPFNNEVTVSWYQPAEGYLSVNVYNIEGRLVERINTSFYEAGKQTLPLSLTNASSGIYLLELEGETTILRKKITLLK